MNRCENHEASVSAWLDGELGRDEQIEMVDHLAGCASCRRFYAQARGLDGWVAAIRTDAAAAPPPEVWQRIVRAKGRRIAPWVLRAAALLVVAVGLGVLVSRVPTAVPRPQTEAEIRLGADAGAMTEGRFVELTREVLRADRRYQVAMYGVMEQVVRDTVGLEGSSEGFVARDESGMSAEAERLRRDPA